MLLAYLDESYSDTRYYLGAVLVGAEAAKAIAAAFDAIVEKAAAAYPELDSQAELHAHELVHGKGDWAPLQSMMRVRIGIYNDAIQAIADAGAKVIIRGVDIERLNQRYAQPDHPHGIVLGHLIERINDHAEARDTHSLMIADEIDERDTYQRDLWLCQRNGSWGYRARPIDRVIDTLYFAPSRASRLLQAADLAVYLYRRIHAHVEADARAEQAWKALWERLEPSIAYAWCWMP